MSRYIDAIKLKSDIMMDAIRFGYNVEDMLSIVDEQPDVDAVGKEIKQPTVDAVEVVRCKDCVYYNGNNKWCDCAIAQSEGYCSHWERIEVKE